MDGWIGIYYPYTICVLAVWEHLSRSPWLMTTQNYSHTYNLFYFQWESMRLLFSAPLLSPLLIRIHFIEPETFSSCFSSAQSPSHVQLLQPHEPQHARAPCPSPTSRVYPNPCPSSRWCHPTISSSVVPFSSCPQSFQQTKKIKNYSQGLSQLYVYITLPKINKPPLPFRFPLQRPFAHSVIHFISR